MFHYFIDGIKIAISQMWLKSSFYLYICLLFVDIEGNILFIPDIRWLFHRNDLIVAHAHVAMGVGVLFMVISMFINNIKELHKSIL